MDKIKTVKIKNLDGSVSQETYTIAVDAKNVDMLNSKDVQETIGNIDVDNDGNIGQQLKNFKQTLLSLNEIKVNKQDIIDNLKSEDTQKVLSANQGKVLNDIINADNYYDEIIYTKERHYDTDCYFTRIPKNDKDNKEIVLYLAQTDVGVTPTKYARDNNTSFTINASLYLGSSVGSGSVIANGQIIEDKDLSSKSDVYKYLGIKANRVLKEYQANQTSAQEMIDDGCLQAFTVYYTLIKDNIIQDMSLIPDLDGDIAGKKHPRQCLGQLEDGTIIILTCDGRTSINAGLTSEETVILLNEKGCVNA